MNYYGLDWLSFVFLIAGQWLISKKNPKGFLLSIVGACCCIAVGFISQAWGVVVMNVVWGALAFKTYLAYKT